jgi:hypothetical protein
MKEYNFQYRGGEIMATVKANSYMEALNKIREGKGEYEIVFDFLWYEFWSSDDEDFSNMNEVDCQ